MAPHHLHTILLLVYISPNVRCCSRNLTRVSSSPNVYTRLWHALVTDHLSFIRPVFNATTVTTITVQSQLYHILDLDEAREVVLYKINLNKINLNNLNKINQILTLTHWVDWTWQDEMMCWNPADFGGVTSITVPFQEVWTPDITMYQQLSADAPLMDNDILVNVFYNGNVTLL
jgi:hypothetical protein